MSEESRVAHLAFQVNLDEFEPLSDMETALPIIHKIALDVAHQVYEQIRTHVHEEWPDVAGMVPRGPISVAMVICAVLDKKYNMTLETHGATDHPLNPEGSYKASFVHKENGQRVVGRGYDAITSFFDVLTTLERTGSNKPQLVLA